MPTFLHIGDGVRTTFRCPSVSNIKTPHVDGKYVHYVDSSTETITLDVAPLADAVVEIFADQPDGDDGYAIPIDKLTGPLLPVVRFHGAASQDTPFTVDFKAKTMDIKAHQVFIDY